MIIIQHATTGEVQAVSSLDGYEADWVQIAEDRAPLPNESWDNGWVLDQARADQQDELAEVISKERLVQALKAARQRVLTLEGQMQQAITEIQSLKARVTTLEGN